MPALGIYDTDGVRIGDSQNGRSERIAQFAPHGGQLTMDASGEERRIVVRFSARESSTNSAEQYYAAYRGDPQELHARLQERLEELGDLTLGIEGDDHIYALFVPGATTEEPDETAPLDRAASLLTEDESGQTTPQVKVGSGGYQHTRAVVQYVLDEGYTDRVAVAEDVDGPELAGYEVVVEQGSYDGIELLPETERLLQTSTDADGRSEHGDGESESDGSPDESKDEDASSLSTVILVGLLLVVLIALAVAGVILLGDTPSLGPVSTALSSVWAIQTDP